MRQKEKNRYKGDVRSVEEVVELIRKNYEKKELEGPGSGIEWLLKAVRSFEAVAHTATMCGEWWRRESWRLQEVLNGEKCCICRLTRQIRCWWRGIGEGSHDYK